MDFTERLLFHQPEIDLGKLDLPDFQEGGQSIEVPKRLLLTSAYLPQDRTLLATRRFGRDNTISVGYAFTSNTGVIDHRVAFDVAKKGLNVELDVVKTFQDGRPLDFPKGFGTVAGILPYGEYHINDFFRGKVGKYSTRFNLTEKGVDVADTINPERVLQLTDPNNTQVTEEKELVATLIAAAFCQSAIDKLQSEPADDTRLYPEIKLSEVLRYFSHGCFLRLHKDIVA